jgi:transposase-like protein
MQKKYVDNSLVYTLLNKYTFAIMKGMRYTLKQFQEEYPDDDSCLEAVFQDRLGDLKFCPRCGAETKFYRVKKRQCYACMYCSHQVFPLADTIFRNTNVPLTSWFYAIYLFSVAKNGVSAKELERHLGVTYRTAWRMAHQIRKLMTDKAARLSGEVEVDETYIGGKQYNRKTNHSTERRKQVVFGMVERNGIAVAKHVPSSGTRALIPQILATVEPKSQVYSDEYRPYKQLPKLGYGHAFVSHSRMQYRKGNAHTQTIEGFWGQLKRSIYGTYHYVSPKYLQTYVDEFVFRYNFRDFAVGPILLERALKPVLSVV